MAKIQDALRKAHPASPWLWRADWASGRMRSSHRAAAVVAWVFPIAFAGLSSPIVWQVRDIVAEKWIGVALVAALSPLVGILLFVRAVFETGRWLRFRGTQLELGTLPVLAVDDGASALWPLDGVL